MEKVIKSRRKEVRFLLKNCFENRVFCLVPFEIWKNIVENLDFINDLGILSQTCWAFREVCVDAYLQIALVKRKEGKIVFATKALLRSANGGNSKAMFHAGYSYWNGGFGLKTNLKISCDWFKKAAEHGNAGGMSYYAYCLSSGDVVSKNMKLSNEWANKALQSNDSFAIGYCHYRALGTAEDRKRAFSYFEEAANNGDEFGQYWAGVLLTSSIAVEKNIQKSFSYHLQAAKQGLAIAQYGIGYMYANGAGCEKDQNLSSSWFKKSKDQGGN